MHIHDALVLSGVCVRLRHQAGEDLHVWGTGSPLRQFIYNVDLGALMVSKHMVFSWRVLQR